MMSPLIERRYNKMASETQFRHEEIAAAPRGWKIRTVTHPSGHQVRIAFPPGRRRSGSGQAVSILHPKPENPRTCPLRNSKSFEEFIRDSKGRRWATSVSESRGGYLAEAFPVSKRGLISRHPLTARGSSAAEASDRLSDEIDRSNPKAKTFTPEQVEKKQEKAVRFLRDVVGDDDKADEIENMSLEDYASKKRIAIRDNPADSAPAMFEKFHGEAPHEIVELQQDVLRRKDYAGLGELVEITVSNAQGEGEIDFEGDGVTLASNSTGTQLYFLGGSQDMRGLFQQFGVDGSKDFIEFGKVEDLVYRTRKKFDQFEEADYTHKMGERGHAKPRLIYDRLNCQLYLVGGEYKIKAEGIVH